MKTMTCKQLGGACDKEFRANSFDEMAQLSREHGKEMFEKQDPAHLAVMKQMQELMQNPDEMQAWFENKRNEFEQLPEDEA